MSEQDDLELMKTLQITTEEKVVYRYREFKYQTLKDAVSFARKDNPGLEKPV